jgi:hypothetical protein
VKRTRKRASETQKESERNQKDSERKQKESERKLEKMKGRIKKKEQESAEGKKVETKTGREFQSFKKNLISHLT